MALPLAAAVMEAQIKRLVPLLLLFIIIQVTFEMAWIFIPHSISLPADTATTAGILDNVLPALFLFLYASKARWFIRIVQRYKTLVSLFWLVWLVNEIGDAILRINMVYIYHYYGAEAAIESSPWMILIGWAYFIVPVIWITYHSKNFGKRTSDKITKTGTFLVFLKPWNAFTLFLTFGINPFSSVSIIHRNKVFYFTKESHCFVKQNIVPEVFNNSYTMEINPPANFGRFLNSKVGSRYHWRKNSCVSVLKGSGIDIGPLDFIPAIFIMRFPDDED